MNAEYIRHMDEAAFTTHAAPYYDQVLPTNDSQKQVLCQILQQRLETFAEIPDKIAFLRALPLSDAERGMILGIWKNPKSRWKKRSRCWARSKIGSSRPSTMRCLAQPPSWA